MYLYDRAYECVCVCVRVCGCMNVPRIGKEVSVYMKTVDPGQILICRQKSTSTVLYGHVNPFARNLHLQCSSNLARDTHRSTFVRNFNPGQAQCIM